jgi:nitrate/TMAO reductase-like tetraheme cytochrome c subunit
LADQAVTILVILSIVLIGLLIVRPSLTAVAGGKILAFVALFILPIAAIALGSAIHLKVAKSTDFCLSCHTMEPYGKSLRNDDQTYIPASHFQKQSHPEKRSLLYLSHTTYAMFGGLKAKLGGLRHLYIYYFETVPEKIALYEPYNNRECLHCHAGARIFEESSPHKEMRSSWAATTCHV